MAQDSDRVHRAARDFLVQSEELDRKADLAVWVHEADVAYTEAVHRLSDAYEAALEGGWSPAQLDALGFSRPRRPGSDLNRRHTRIVRRSSVSEHPRTDDAGNPETAF